jgi:hypothetical protein
VGGATAFGTAGSGRAGSSGSDGSTRGCSLEISRTSIGSGGRKIGAGVDQTNPAISAK